VDSSYLGRLHPKTAIYGRIEVLAWHPVLIWCSWYYAETKTVISIILQNRNIMRRFWERSKIVFIDPSDCLRFALFCVKGFDFFSSYFDILQLYNHYIRHATVKHFADLFTINENHMCSDDFIYKNKANLRKSDGSIKDYLTSFSKSTHDFSIL
jgi:hypothetical protein